MSPRRSLAFLLCLIGLCGLALLAGESARADGLSWRDLQGREFFPTTAQDGCPEGLFRDIPSRNGGENLIMLGARFSATWKRSGETLLENGACRTQTTTTVTGNMIEIVTMDDKCQDASQNGKRTESLHLLENGFLAYETQAFNAEGKLLRKLTCGLAARPVSK